mgnify:CR=1 FL=1
MIGKEKTKTNIEKILVSNANCSGCHACYAICPKNCVSMINDDEGFWYPKVNEKYCINCGLCIAKCPILNEVKKGENLTAYAAQNKDLAVRLNSSSGGVFSLLAEYAIDRGGTVFGAAFDEDLNVHHRGIDKKDNIQLLQGSKYVQSKISDCYQKAKKLLDAGGTVLFSGTPCQIAGLRSFLGKPYENLILVDIFCLGVPSPKVWRKHLENCRNIKKTRIKSYSFRDKLKGWRNYYTKIDYLDGNFKRIPHHLNPYMRAFLSAVCLRPSCYSCKFKGMQRHSDVTLADFWGIENIMPAMDDDKGTSLMLVHSEKVENILTSIADKLIIQEVDVEQALVYNSAALRSVKANSKRKQFLSSIEHMPFNLAVKKYCEPSLIKKFLSIIRKMLSKIKDFI